MSHEEFNPNPSEYNSTVDRENQKNFEDIKRREESAHEIGRSALTLEQFQKRFPNSDEGVWMNEQHDLNADKSRAFKGVAYAEEKAKEHYKQNEGQIMTNAKIEMDADLKIREARDAAQKAFEAAPEKKAA